MTGDFGKSDVDTNVEGAQKDPGRNDQELHPMNQGRRLLSSVNYFFINNALSNNLKNQFFGNHEGSIDKGVMKLHTSVLVFILRLKMALKFENKNQYKSN